MQAQWPPLPAQELSFAASVRMAVEYPSTSRRMSVVRVDRQGFIASVPDDIGLPPLGLPQPARVLCSGKALCELRLVPRSFVRPEGRLPELTMQPSRADDDLLFWRALHAQQHIYPDMPGRMERTGNGPDAIAGRWRSPLTEPESSPPIATGTGHDYHCRAATGQTGQGSIDSAFRCEALFELPDGHEALVFSEWLECHLPEITVLARIASCPADLCDVDRHQAGPHVAIVFSYQRGSMAVYSTTAAVCSRVAHEMQSHFGVSLRYQLLVGVSSRHSRGTLPAFDLGAPARS